MLRVCTCVQMCVLMTVCVQIFPYRHSQIWKREKKKDPLLNNAKIDPVCR